MRLLVVATFVVAGCKGPPPDNTAKSAKPAEGSGSGSSIPGPTPADASKAATTTSSEAKLHRYQECWAALESGQDEVFASCFAAGSVREQVDAVPELVAEGIDRIVEMARTQKAAFPDLKVTPEIVVVSGNTIAAILHVTGTNTGEAGGMKATMKKLGVFEAEIAVMDDDGTISRDSFYVDQPTIFYQLGLIEKATPASPNATDKPLGQPKALIAKNDEREAANKALVAKKLDAIAKKNPNGIEADVADDIKFTYHGEKQKIENKKAYMGWMRETLRATTESKIEVKGIWAAGDFVVVSDVFTGTPSKEMGKAAEGRKIETHVVQFFEISAGKIKEHHIFANRLKTAIQLGMVEQEALMKVLSGGDPD
jgi:predicted ester cyclase